MSNKKFSISFKGKGYYIALVLCAVAIGISGYLYYKNTNEPAENLQTPVSVTDPLTGDVQTGANTGNTTTDPTGQTPTEPEKKPGKITRPVSGDTVVEYAMVGENTVIGKGAHVGTQPDGSEGWGVATCGPDIQIRDGAVVPAGAMIYTGEEV